MIEGDAIQPEIKPEYVHPLTKLNSFSVETAEASGLNPLRTEGLRKFATARYRIGRFEELSNIRFSCSIIPTTSDMSGNKIKFHPEDIPLQLEISKQIAFSVWDEYLSGNTEAESAANEVIIFVNNLLTPKDQQ